MFFIILPLQRQPMSSFSWHFFFKKEKMYTILLLLHTTKQQNAVRCTIFFPFFFCLSNNIYYIFFCWHFFIPFFLSVFLLVHVCIEKTHAYKRSENLIYHETGVRKANLVDFLLLSWIRSSLAATGFLHVP